MSEEEKVVGEPQEVAAPETNDFQVPDKFKADTEKESLQKAVTSYQELEKELGKKGNTSAEIAEIKQSLTDLRSVIEQGQKPKDDVENADLLNQHKEYIRSMGFATAEDVTKAKELGRKEAELDRINETLQEKYNGKDGRPVYDRQVLTDFAKQNGYTNLHPETVYKLMHEKGLDDWKIKQAFKGNHSPSVLEGGKKTVKPAGDEPDVSKMPDPERIEHMKQRAMSYME